MPHRAGVSMPAPAQDDFATWQARRLLSRSALCFVWMLGTYLDYLRLAIPQLCAMGPELPAPTAAAMRPGNSTTHAAATGAASASAGAAAMPVPPEHWPAAWQLACGHWTASPEAAGRRLLPALFGRLEAAAAECAHHNTPSRELDRLTCSAQQAALVVLGKLARAAALLLQALVIFVGLGLLHRDLAHTAVAPCKALLALATLLPLPRAARTSHAAPAADCAAGVSGSSSTAPRLWRGPCGFWLQPRRRWCLLVAQRLSTALVAACSVVGGGFNSRLLHVTCLGHCSGPGIFMFAGWTSWMLVLPLRLQLVVSCLEWALLFSTSLHVNAVAGSQPRYVGALASLLLPGGAPALSAPTAAALDQLLHLLFSVGCVVVLPALAVAAMEKQAAASFRQQQAQQLTATPSASKQQHAAQKSSGGGRKDEQFAGLGRSKQPAGDGRCKKLWTPDCSSHLSSKSSTPAAALGVDSTARETDAAQQHRFKGFVSATCPQDPAAEGAAGQLTAPSTPEATAPDVATCSLDSSLASTAIASEGFLADIAGSLQLAALAAAPAALAASPLAVPPAAAASGPVLQPERRAGRSNRRPPAQQSQQLPDILPALRGVLGAEQAAAVFSAAATQSGSTAPQALPEYKSLADKMSVSIKVHSTPHASLPALAPLLAGAASRHLAAAGAAAAAGCPVYLQSAAFLGCVQLLASVFSLKPDAGQADAGSYGSSSSIAASPQPVQACSKKPRTDELAARLLDAVCFAAAGAAGVIAGTAAPAVDVVVGSSVASRRPPPADADAAPGDQPAAAAAAAATGKDTSSNAAAVQAAAALELLYCQPGCIAAGRERQQLELTVSLGSSGASSLPCRLLVLQGGAVVAEVPEVVLRQSARQASTSIRVALPIMAAGVAQVALLPAAAAAASGGGTAAPPSAAVPLLLQPLLVLPEAAATELEAFFQSHAAEAAVAALTSGQDSARAIAAAAAAAWSVQSSLTVDLAYAMSAADDLSSDSKAAAAIAVASSRSSGVSDQAGVLPAGVRAVLTHLLTHLASWHCWSTLEFVVQHLAAASAATAARAEAAAATPAGPAEAATGFSSSPSAAAAFAVAESDDVSDWTLADMAPAAQREIDAVERTLAQTPAAATEGGAADAAGARAKAAPSQGSGASSSSTSGRSSVQSPRSTAVEFDPDSKPTGGAADSASSSSLPAGPEPSKTTDLQAAAADELRELQQRPRLRAAARQLRRGFCSRPVLETCYLDGVAAQTFGADVFATVYALAVGLSASLVTDGLHVSASGSGASASMLLVAWEVASRVVNFILLVVPNFVLLLNRHKLLRNGRRERAAVLCEVALAVCPVSTATGILLASPSIEETLRNPALTLTVMLWATGVFKAACRQVRMRRLLPALLAEFVGATVLSVNLLGLSVGLSVLRYAGTVAGAALTAGLLELHSRKAFLHRLTAPAGSGGGL